jgi:polysaccharide export outer membrane protein
VNQAPRETAKAQASGHSASPDYRIGPEDVLHLSVWGNPDLTLDLVVRPDGMISLPLIQDVQAGGLTTTELSDRIHRKLLAFIKDPQVSVIVKEIQASRFHVMGYVFKPGTYPLRGDTSVLQALSLAGGSTQFASPRSIRLVRKAKGTQEIRAINYYDIIDSGEGNWLLMPGDTIIVQ